MTDSKQIAGDLAVEFLCQFARFATGVNKFNHLLTKLRRIRAALDWASRTPSWGTIKCPRNEVSPTQTSDARSVFEGMTYTFEDDRFSYGEQRFVTLGLLAGITVSVVHTESENEIRIISFRKATKRESQIYFDAIQN